MKRWTLRILFLLILGGVTTVAVAWGIAWRAIWGTAPRDAARDKRYADLWTPARPDGALLELHHLPRNRYPVSD